jgi:hypothetical protein
LKLGFLQWVRPGGKFRYSKWAEIGAERGVEFCTLRTKESDFRGTEAERRRFVDKALQLLEECDAFVIPNNTNYSDLTRIHQRIAEGARLVYIYQFVTDESFRDADAFLAHYDMAPTKKRILWGLGSHQWLIKLKRDAGCFLDGLLFRGVDEVVITHPYLLWYVDQAFPVMIATDEHWVLDQAMDLPDGNDLRRYFKNALKIPPELLEQYSVPEGWNVRDLACMAVRYNENKGGVLAVTSDLFSDFSVAAPPYYYPGIEGNERLARNVLDFLCENDPAIEVERLSKQIEVNLTDFVLGKIKALNENWRTEYIPPGVQKKWAGRRKRQGNRFSPEHYLDLPDLKSIMNKQWRDFEPAFRTLGLEGGEEKCLAWMDRLNEIRIMVAHAAKKHLSKYRFSPDDHTFLRECHALVLKLKKSRV